MVNETGALDSNVDRTDNLWSRIFPNPKKMDTGDIADIKMDEELDLENPLDKDFIAGFEQALEGEDTIKSDKYSNAISSIPGVMDIYDNMYGEDINILSKPIESTEGYLATLLELKFNKDLVNGLSFSDGSDFTNSSIAEGINANLYTLGLLNISKYKPDVKFKDGTSYDKNVKKYLEYDDKPLDFVSNIDFENTDLSSYEKTDELTELERVLGQLKYLKETKNSLSSKEKSSDENSSTAELDNLTDKQEMLNYKLNLYKGTDVSGVKFRENIAYNKVADTNISSIGDKNEYDNFLSDKNIVKEVNLYSDDFPVDVLFNNFELSSFSEKLGVDEETISEYVNSQLSSEHLSKFTDVLVSDDHIYVRSNEKDENGEVSGVKIEEMNIGEVRLGILKDILVSGKLISSINEKLSTTEGKELTDRDRKRILAGKSKFGGLKGSLNNIYSFYDHKATIINNNDKVVDKFLDLSSMENYVNNLEVSIDGSSEFKMALDGAEKIVNDMRNSENTKEINLNGIEDSLKEIPKDFISPELSELMNPVLTSLQYLMLAADNYENNKVSIDNKTLAYEQFYQKFDILKNYINKKI